VEEKGRKRMIDGKKRGGGGKNGEARE